MMPMSELTCRLVANHAVLAGMLNCPVADALRWLALFLLLFQLLRLILNQRLTRQLIRQTHVFEPDQYPHLIALLDRLTARVGLGRAPLLVKGWSTRHPAFTIGFRRPVIFLHPRLVSTLDEQELAAVLTHELVHIKRKDQLLLWTADLMIPAIPLLLIQLFAIDFACRPGTTLMILAATVLLVWLVHKGIHLWFRSWREHSCDDRTVSLIGMPLALASALVKTWQFIRGGVEQRGLPARCMLLLVERPNVETRVRRLLSYRPPRLKPLLGTGAGLLGAVLVLAYLHFLWDYHVSHRYEAATAACVAHARTDAGPGCSSSIGGCAPATDALSQCGPTGGSDTPAQTGSTCHMLAGLP